MVDSLAELAVTQEVESQEKDEVVRMGMELRKALARVPSFREAAAMAMLDGQTETVFTLETGEAMRYSLRKPREGEYDLDADGDDEPLDPDSVIMKFAIGDIESFPPVDALDNGEEFNPHTEFTLQWREKDGKRDGGTLHERDDTGERKITPSSSKEGLKSIITNLKKHATLPTPRPQVQVRSDM